ncbi:MAG: penicillin-insensitive murein endopeptidase [Elusimicrobia bacterium]|nr:penicillin-insensitive murein endopeptidase [Elusimicrobiota bacterium]
MFLAAIFSVFPAFAASKKTKVPDNPWPALTSPAPGAAEAIGGYGAGCLRGGEKVAAEDPSYQVMRPQRLRDFAHPDLVAFLRNLAARCKKEGLEPFLLGDIGQARGGPTSSFHASHQIGLDADIWYWRPEKGKRFTKEERETVGAPNMVVPYFEKPSEYWKPEMLETLRLASDPPEVERIFVDPIIKQEACKKYPGAAWLRRLRPLWGHDNHFHVRLSCPKASPQCRGAKEPVPEGDGCGEELASWFTPASKAEAKRRALAPYKPRMPTLPDACKPLLKD